MRIIPRGRRKTLLVLFLCSGLVSILLYFVYNISALSEKCWDTKCLKRDLMRNLSMCTLPRLDPFDDSIAHLLTTYSPDLSGVPVCQGIPKVFELVGGKIRVRDNALLDNVLSKSVKYETIQRMDGNDNGITYGQEVFVFKNKKKMRQIDSDFVKVSYRMEDRSRKIEMFAQIVKKKELDGMQSKEHKLNVVLIGFDSTSNANFQRQLAGSYHHLINKLQAFVFNGYSIVGDGTTPALTAMLTGKWLKPLKEDLESLDDWPWIMKDYKGKGYVTLYAEDDPRIASFNLRLGGFVAQPADHYIRPYWLAVEQHGLNGHKRNKTDLFYRVCFENEPLHNVTLNYVMSFLGAYSDMPKFAFSYLSYLPHGTGEKLNLADKDLLLFLRNYEKYYHKDSILIIFGDHGARVGPVRNTVQGSYEERLPWLSIVTPPWFQQKYPDIAKNLGKNQNLVTSPFDVHHTLHHILNLGKTNPSVTSLFSPLSSDRSCTDAGVDEHWCPCLNWKKVDVGTPHIQAAASMLVNEINKILGKKSIFIELCFTIYLVDILVATKLENVGSSKITKESELFQVTVATNPGGGIFQGTFQIDADLNVLMNHHVSRTSTYGRNPWCLPSKYHYMRRFCTCRQVLSSTKHRGKRRQ